jgi:predicted dehydrogenase
MTAALRTLLVGYGLGGEAFHAPFLATTPGLELTTIVTGDPERRERARRRFPEVRLAATMEEALDAGEHDAAVIATANVAHVGLALAAIERGLHTVVDKPLAVASASGRQVVEAAREAGVVLSVYQNRRWDDDFTTLRRLLEEGALGMPLRFESRFERWRPAVEHGRWREEPAPEQGGGLLLDLGSHLVDQAIQLFGAPRTVYAELDARRAGAAVDDDVFVALTHHSGVRSHLWASATAANPGPRFRLLGSRAAFTSDGLDPQEDELRAGRLPTDEGFGVRPVTASLGTPGSEVAVPLAPGRYAAFYEGFVAAVREGAPPPVDPLDAVLALEVLEAARRSAHERTVVTLG